MTGEQLAPVPSSPSICPALSISRKIGFATPADVLAQPVTAERVVRCYMYPGSVQLHLSWDWSGGFAASDVNSVIPSALLHNSTNPRFSIHLSPSLHHIADTNLQRHQPPQPASLLSPRVNILDERQRRRLRVPLLGTCYWDTSLVSHKPCLFQYGHNHRGLRLERLLRFSIL